MVEPAKDTLLIIPAYNEEKKIGQVLDGIRAMDLDMDCLVVDDGSRDATSEIARSYGVLLLRHPFNMGYGVALHTGFKYAVRKGYRLVVTMDADGQHSVDSIEDLLRSQREKEADVVIGSRFLSESPYPFPVLRHAVRWFMILLSYLFLGKRISDPTSGFQVMRKSAFSFLSKIDYPEDYPDVDIIILLGLSGFQIEEAAVKMEPRTTGRSIHSGLKPLYYLYKFVLSMIIILINARSFKGRQGGRRGQ